MPRCLTPKHRLQKKAFVAEAAVQALDEAVVGGLAGRDVVSLDAVLLLPQQERARRQFSAVVGHDHQRPAARLGNGVQLRRHPHV